MQVRWKSTLARTDWKQESHVAKHYRGLFNDRPSVTWQEVLDEALRGQPSSAHPYRIMMS